MAANNRDHFSPSPIIDELNIEEIAKIENVIGSDQGFIASDNLESSTCLSRDYINSIGNFKVGSLMKLRFNIMLFCVSGEMEVQLNLIRLTIHPGEVLMVHEGTVTTILKMDSMIRLVCIGFTRNYLLSLPPSRLVNMFLGRFIVTPLVALGEKDMSEILDIYRVISGRLSKTDFKLKTEMIWSGMQIMGCIILDSLKDTPSERSLSRKEIIVNDFMHLVGKYASVQRDIPFYARKLCISTKYLGQVVSEISGETPRKWICRQVILEAKALLEDPLLTVQQVSEALNFANQSFFGTFFRSHTGLSPKEYRFSKTSDKSIKEF